MTTTIDSKLANQLLDLIPKAYFGNTCDYGNGFMGYHVGWMGTIFMSVKATDVEDWQDMSFTELTSMLEGLVAANDLPVNVSPAPELVGKHWQVYFTINDK
jgi:hypothetical protein